MISMSPTGGDLSAAPVLLAPGSTGPNKPFAPKSMPGGKGLPGSPLGGLTGGTNVSAQSTWQEPQYISEASTQSAVNNRMGQAHMMGDQRIFQKQFARNGLGASKGTNYFSGIGQQQALSQGRADSAGIQAQDQMNNAKARLDYQYGREREAQEMAMAQWGIEQANWAQGFAGQQAQATINTAQQKAVMDMLRRLLS